ncbi:hypothetical protein CHARACLAT_024408 [Characodon lateralis]|uniref:Uncharacterized protein n=1 Tax=Characodon lateralis TaxID=208331 RepID=A0ABU7EXV7_9TELE|nr:hypothetical protein [Characodon lateralis]
MLLLEMDRDKRHLDLGTIQHDGVNHKKAVAAKLNFNKHSLSHIHRGSVKDDHNKYHGKVLHLWGPANDEGSHVSTRTNWDSEKSNVMIDGKGRHLSGGWNCWQEITSNY